LISISVEIAGELLIKDSNNAVSIDLGQTRQIFRLLKLRRSNSDEAPGNVMPLLCKIVFASRNLCLERVYFGFILSIFRSIYVSISLSIYVAI
jgi:hypothetical protein